MTGMGKHLQAGQLVRLDDRAGLYQITLLTGEQVGSTVVEVGHDFVLLEDTSAGVRTRVPLHLITAVSANPPEVLQAA